MLKRKSNQWARLKLLLFAPLAVVLLQAFARPETVRIQESLINSEGTTISQQSQQWTKDYFDEKIDSFVQRVSGNTKDCKKWTQAIVQGSDRVYSIETIQRNDSIRPFLSLHSYNNTKCDKGLDNTIRILIDYLKDVENKRYEKNLYSPSIVYLTTKNLSDSDVQSILNALGALNEEFTKAREEQLQKAKESKIKSTFTELYSDVPIYVAINERRKQFPPLTHTDN